MLLFGDRTALLKTSDNVADQTYNPDNDVELRQTFSSINEEGSVIRSTSSPVV